MSDDTEYSESGVRIYRYEAKEKPFQIVEGDADALEAIEDHIEKHVGKIDTVMHELVSDLVHIDVHIVEPAAERNYYTLITSGMSDLPMTIPDGAEEFRFAELLVCLPAGWDMPKVYDAMIDEEHWWPRRIQVTQSQRKQDNQLLRAASDLQRRDGIQIDARRRNTLRTFRPGRRQRAFGH